MTSTTYHYRVEFTREFTAGTLAGINHQDRIDFVHECSARDWMRAVEGLEVAGAIGGSDYRITDARLVPVA